MRVRLHFKDLTVTLITKMPLKLTLFSSSTQQEVGCKLRLHLSDGS